MPVLKREAKCKSFSLRGARFAKCAYSALPLFYSLFRFKNHHCNELYTCIRKALSLRRARLAEYRFLNLHILHFRFFISLCCRPRHKKPDFLKDFSSIRRFLEILGIFRKKWDFGGFLDDLEQNLFYTLCRFI